MEDEGSLMTHRTGISSTHGAWTHVALTWRSVDGRAQLYVDGRLAAVMTRAQVCGVWCVCVVRGGIECVCVLCGVSSSPLIPSPLI